MTIWATINPIQFFDDELGPVPAEAIEITAAQHDQYISDQYSGKILTSVNGQITAIDYVPTTTDQITAIDNQLSQLDIYLPRSLEDYFAATSFDTTKLPQVQQMRLSTKQSLRAQRATLAASTPAQS